MVLDAGKPAFPRLDPSPGIYRLTFTSTAAQPATRLYIGETENLHRRLSVNYRHPGPSQQTNVRINALLREQLTAGGAVCLAAATSATVWIGNQEQHLDLTGRNGRLLAESAALVYARAAGDAQVVNLG
ncbi:hypothetical protein [Actinoplanes aureus]|uniref:Uncharacterized protein n=1 Tax=Actinoplanes aureus TaxID=2792083 RepID=A0A931CAZ8_9ACTN|nr:hypothetical protein [Actinoplanes aureus]MBG0565384.1 hypothetical protein [Actinoplanes aureus]